jgi:phage tail tape-measure protein
MNKLLLNAVAIALVAVPSIAVAQSTNADANGGAVVGGTAGGATGAVVGGLIFGPIGAVIGGFTGATIGASAGVQASSVDYARLNPTEPVVIDGQIDVGYAVPAEIELHQIQNDPTYGYFYTNDRVYFVNLSDRTVVYSPGVVVAAKAN